MKIRVLSFGYKMVNGGIVIAEEEANIVEEIFTRYSAGEILMSIADDLTKRKIVYFQDKTEWNKNMVARIIENRKYKGEDGYPTIISDSVFDNANDLKASKAVKKSMCRAEVDYLRNRLVCAQSGNRVYRHPSWSKREKWICTNGCKNDIYIGDQELIKCTVDVLKKAKEGNNYFTVTLQNNEYKPSLDVIKDLNEINRLLDQSDIQFQIVKNLIFKCAERKFLCCADNSVDMHSTYVQKCFAEWVEDDVLDVVLMKKVVNKILLEKNGSVTVILINGSIINGRE